MVEELADKYFQLISRDHHKDKDCHFYIKKVWSYGQKPYYVVEHNGYLNYYKYNTKFESYYDAENDLIVFLHEIIAEEERVIAAEN